MRHAVVTVLVVTSAVVGAAPPAGANHALPYVPSLVVDEHEDYADAWMRSRCGQLPTYVEYKTVDDAARAGEDCVAVSGQAAMSADQQEARIRIPIIDDGLSEGEEKLTIVVRGRTASEWPAVPVVAARVRAGSRVRSRAPSPSATTRPRRRPRRRLRPPPMRMHPHRPPPRRRSRPPIP